MPVPRGLVRKSVSPGLAPPLRRMRSGWTAPMTARPYLGSGSRWCGRRRGRHHPRARSPRHPRRWPSSSRAAAPRGRRRCQREEDAPAHRETSLMALAAAMAPKVAGSSTSGGRSRACRRRPGRRSIGRRRRRRARQGRRGGRLASPRRHAIRGAECTQASERLGQHVGAQLGGAATAARLSVSGRPARSVRHGRRGHGRPMIRGLGGATIGRAASPIAGRYPGGTQEEPRWSAATPPPRTPTLHPCP